MHYPNMLRMRQDLVTDHIPDLEGHLSGRLKAALAKSELTPTAPLQSGSGAAA